jgi:hypothetical protein
MEICLEKQNSWIYSLLFGNFVSNASGSNYILKSGFEYIDATSELSRHIVSGLDVEKI